MKVKLIIYSNLKNYVDGYLENEGVLKEINREKKIREFLLDTIKHEKALEGISMIIINGKVIPFNQIDSYIKDGDIIKVYPPMGGG